MVDEATEEGLWRHGQDMIRVGLIGYGSWTRAAYLPALRRDGRATVVSAAAEPVPDDSKVQAARPADDSSKRCADAESGRNTKRKINTRANSDKSAEKKRIAEATADAALMPALAKCDLRYPPSRWFTPCSRSCFLV